MHNKSFHLKETLSAALGNNIDISLDYHSYLGIVQGHLKSLYGERADWKRNLEKYYSGSEYHSQCHIVENVDAIPEVTFEDILELLDEEEKYNRLVDRVMELYSAVLISDNCSCEEYAAALCEVEGIIGLNPFYKGPVICEWMLDLDHFSEADTERYKGALSKGGAALIITNILCNEYIPGMHMRYPGAGITMLQRKSKNYYRGENACYGKSQPSAFRHADWKLNDRLQLAVDDLRCFEAAGMFLELDAVKHWGYSEPNYWALGQHYGLWTNVLDITSSLKTALFFACCKYAEGKWLPLSGKDFEYQNSRQHVANLGGDSRYGMIFTCPTEINMMQYGVSEENQRYSVILPVGFQPFMRCSAQSAYVLPVYDRSYDLYKDRQFSKFRFRLAEDICNWIYGEMKEGELIYPNHDVPDLSGQINEINKARNFSKRAFDDLVKFAGFTETYAREIRKQLQASGYYILDYNKSYFKNNRLAKLNKRYALERSYELTPCRPVCKPMVTLYGK